MSAVTDEQSSPAARAHDLPRQSRGSPPRGRLHAHRLVQALVLLHLPRHRAGTPRHRLGQRVRRGVHPRAAMGHRPHHRRRRRSGARSASRSATSSSRCCTSTRSSIWDYGTRASFTNLLRLGVICFAIFATFIAFGVIVSVLLGRARDGVSRMYFSDLVGAGLGCLLAIPLITRLGPAAGGHARGARVRASSASLSCRAQVDAVRLRGAHERRCSW